MFDLYTCKYSTGKLHILGLYEKALNPSDSWAVRLRKAEALGFDYMEISIDESDARLARLDWDMKQIESLRRTCFDAGIGIQSMCLSAHRRFPFGSANSATRKKAFEIMEKAFVFATTMGIRVIQLAGYDVYYEPSTPESVRLFHEGMLWAVRQAAKYQVMLGMEIMDTVFMNSISKHIGEGCVDFPRRFGQLEKLGYTGPYMIEMWCADGASDVEQVRQAKIWLEQQFQMGMEE